MMLEYIGAICLTVALAAWSTYGINIFMRFMDWWFR